MSYENSLLQVNTADHRFEIMVEREKAFIDYKQSGHKIYLVHTEVPASIEGKGVASALVEKTLKYIEEHHLTLVPLCAFVQSYVKKHPEWQWLVVTEE